MISKCSVKVFLWVISILCLLCLTSCQATQNANKPVESDKSNTLSFVMPGESTSYDPNKSVETYSGIVLDHCFERLVAIDQKGEIVPAAAESWIVSSDGLTYTFKLRKNAKWSDGKPVVADDFRYSWIRLIDPDSHFDGSVSFAPYIENGQAFFNREVVADAVGIKVIDPLTLEVKLSAPTSFFLSMVTMWNYSPVRGDIIEQNGATWDQNPMTFVSNGPYRMKANEKGSYVLLEKNANYWNANAIKTSFIKVLFEYDVAEGIERFKTGEVDGVYQILASDLRSIPDLESNIYLKPSLSTSFMILNHKNELISEQDFRNALAAMIDRQKIVEDVLLGAGTASRYLVPSSLMMAGEPFNDFTALSVLPEATTSKAFMEKLKKKGLNLDQKLKVLYMTNSPDEKSVRIISDLWIKELGLNLELEGLAWTDLFERCQKGEYDIAMFGYGADYPHPMTFLSLFLKNSMILNLIGWKDDKLHDDLIMAMRIQDEEESLKVLRELEKEIIEGNHILPLYSRKVISLMSDRVVGWSRDQLSHFNFVEVDLK